MGPMLTEGHCFYISAPRSNIYKVVQRGTNCLTNCGIYSLKIEMGNEIVMVEMELKYQGKNYPARRRAVYLFRVTAWRLGKKPYRK